MRRWRRDDRPIDKTSTRQISLSCACINNLRLSTWCFQQKVFFKFAATLVDLLFIELMLHFSHVKQMYRNTVHHTHELTSCIQIIRRRVDLTEIPSWKLIAGAKIRTMIFQPRFFSCHVFGQRVFGLSHKDVFSVNVRFGRNVNSKTQSCLTGRTKGVEQKCSSPNVAEPYLVKGEVRANILERPN